MPAAAQIILVWSVYYGQDPVSQTVQIGGTARGYQALFASLAVAVPGAHGPAGGRPGALPVRLIVAALA